MGAKLAPMKIEKKNVKYAWSLQKIVKNIMLKIDSVKQINIITSDLTNFDVTIDIALPIARENQYAVQISDATSKLTPK